MIKKVIIYVLIGTILTVVPLYYANNFILSDDNVVITGSTEGGGLPNKFANIKIKLPVEAQNVSMLYDQDYISYIDSGVLYIKNIFDDNMTREINESSPVIYALPLEDRNIVMYFTAKDDKIDVKTYNLDSNEKINQKSIIVKNFYRIDSVRYSSLMNVIYIDAQTISNRNIKDDIYRIDIMKHTSLYTGGKKIKDMDLMYNVDTLVYQDTSNNIYIKNKLFTFQNYKKFMLLGIDIRNQVYITPVDDPSVVFIVKKGKVYSKEYVDDTGYIENMDVNNNIYLVYKDHVLDLSDNKTINKSPDTKVLDINSGNILLENTTGGISIEKI